MRVLAVDIGGTAIKSALLDEGGQVLQEGETPSEGRQGGERLMERAKAVIDGYAGYDAMASRPRDRSTRAKGASSSPTRTCRATAACRWQKF